MGGKAGKAAALPGFFKIEYGGGIPGLAAAVLVVWLPLLPKIYHGGPVPYHIIIHSLTPQPPYRNCTYFDKTYVLEEA